MGKKTILVTGIGGNVGQGILRIINSLKYDVRIIGTDIQQFSSGNHLCDKVYAVPFSYKKTYLPSIKQIIKKEKVAVVLPSTDYETYYLSKYQHELDCVVVAAEEKMAAIYLDKYQSYLHHKKHDIPFAPTYLTGAYKGPLKNIIAKPRKGRGARGIVINPADISTLGDSYIIQPLLKGKEITTAVYISKKNEIHGLITMERELESGTTVRSKVVFDYDSQLRAIAQSMISTGTFKGSFNIQSMVSKTGKVTPFEINCRISGTNSIRHNFGFRDVAYAVQEYLFNEIPDKVKIQPGVASRILMDVIYLNARETGHLNKRSKHRVF